MTSHTDLLENPTIDRDGEPAMRLRAGFSTSLAVFTTRSLRHSLRDVESLLMAILLPLMLMLVFVYVFGESIATGSGGDRSDYLAYVLPAITITTAGFGASYTAVVVSNDMTTGFMNRLRTMPFPSITVLLGHTAASMARNLLATAVVFASAFALGFRTESGALEFLGAVSLIALWILVITSLFAMLGLVAGSAEAASGYGFILLFLPYVSSGFAPVETMPDWLQWFAGTQPMTPIIDASRALLNSQPVGSDWWIGTLWCLGFIAASVALTAWIFPRKVAR